MVRDEVDSQELKQYYKTKKNEFKKIKINSRCPKRLKSLPLTPCKMGMAAFFKPSNPSIKPCPWAILSKDAHYCFWAHQALYNRRDYTFEDTALLLNLTTSDIFKIENKAEEKLRKAYKTPQNFILLNKSNFHKKSS